jgi:AcrR family transcriptional regulator
MATAKAAPDQPDVPAAVRLQGEARRTSLVDAAARLLAAEGVDAVSMETVAAAAGVSRPLVYKHFANRSEVLAAVFRWQAARLDAAIVEAVEREIGFEAKLRAAIGAIMQLMETPDAGLADLARAGVDTRGFRQDQRARDLRTVHAFARLATEEFGLPRTEANAAMAILLTGIESVRAQWKARPTPRHRRFLEDLYVDVVVGGLTRLAARDTL